MNAVYNLAINLFRMGVRVVAMRRPKARKLVDGERMALDRLRQSIDQAHDYIWIHAASLGEFEQGRPLIEMLRRERPGQHILLTFFSPSGYEVRCNYPEVDAVSYLPFDTPSRVRAFLDIVHPSMAIFVKYEFWGNYLQELRRRSIPVYIVSAIFRPAQIFFKPWGGIFRDMLKCYTRLYVQDDNSRRLLAGIGITDVTVAGDTRFDRVTDIMRQRVDIPEAASVASRGDITIVAGSTWGPDEKILIPYFNAHPALRLIIAPHEIDEERLRSIESLLARPSVRLSKATPEDVEKAECLIIDCFGKLSSMYRYGDIAYIGGGFGAGIHNINEAAVYDMPILFGPNYHKFKEAHDMLACGGAFTFTDSESFASVLDPIIQSPDALAAASRAAGEYIRAHLGATERIYADLFPSE